MNGGMMLRTDHTYRHTKNSRFVFLLAAAASFLLALPVVGTSLWQQHLKSTHLTVFALRLPSGHIFLSEDPQHPRLQELRRQEGLDDIVSHGSTDMEKILALAQWASSLFKATTPFPNYPPWDALTILRM